MKTTIKFALIIATLSMSFSSCLNDSYNASTAYGDVFIKSTLLEDSTIAYNIELYTYSSSEMASVSVYSESDPTHIELDTIDYKYTFAYRPDEVKYLKQPPASDKYFFWVTFQNGEEIMANDYLSTDYLTPPQVDSLIWDNEDKQIILKWKKVSKAQLYNIVLLDSEDKPVFESELLKSNVTNLIINQFTTGWYANKKPTQNGTYRVVINAYLFEPVYTIFDIQCISVNDKNKIEWIVDETE